MTLKDQVREFQAMTGRSAPETPKVPRNADVRLRLALIIEEAFEVVEACFDGGDIPDLKAQTLDAIRTLDIDGIDLPAFADGLADLDFVVEGTRQEFGIDGAPIADAVYRANMAKLGGPTCPKTGKHLKPPGWTPPDIEGELVKQGWK